MTPNHHCKFHPTRFFLSAFAAIFIGVLAACQSAPERVATNTPTPTQAPDQTPVPQTPTPAPDEPITLTLWLPTRFLPQEGNTAYDVLHRQLTVFARTEDGVPVRLAVKQDHGPGGLLDLLRTASPVAPAVLPDIIALDSVDLETAARAGLLQPIDALLPADLINDLFPFARDLVTINGETFGLIYSADVEHLITMSNDPAPTNWLDLLDTKQRYVFAPHDGSKNVSDAVLAHYLSSAGSLVDDQGKAVLKPLALQSLLENYQMAQQQGELPSNFQDLTGPDDAWAAWRTTRNGLAQIQATRYLSVEDQLPNAHVASIPGLLRTAPSIGRGWAFAIVTRDQRRQTAASHLLQYLLAPQNNGEWTQAAGVLPGSQGALGAWDQAQTYTGFIRDQLLQAHAAPLNAVANVIQPALRKALDDVLAGRATPVEAAQTAATTVNGNKK
jgi:ABC-type glycerol-3-phosphate transport system substrate-binding protein